MSSIWDQANPHLRDLALYEPGKPIEETARESGLRPEQIIKLASNENPLGPSPHAVEAMQRALTHANFYPDGGSFYLRDALAHKLGLTRENIILGNGSNEIIEFIGHAFLRSGVEMVTSENAFIAYKLIAALFAATTVAVPDREFRFDLDAVLAAITPRTRVVFIANPNNPTGTLVRQEALDRFMEQVRHDVVVVFDEAYFEYLDEPPDTLRFVRQGRNVIVLRTFSKIHGLANLRLGYGMAHPEMIRVLQKTREPFNINGLVQAGALASLADEKHQAATKRTTDEGRKYLESELAAMKLPFVPSVANFVLVRVGDGHAVFRAMLQKGVIVRALKGYKLPEWIRISIGTMEQNRQCIASLREVVASAVPADSAELQVEDGAARDDGGPLCAEDSARYSARRMKKKPPRLERLFTNEPLFFVTFNTHGRRPLLADGSLHETFVAYAQGASEHGIGVGRYVLMPDHIHLFISFGRDATADLGTWVKGLKRALEKTLLAAGEKPVALDKQTLSSFWQPGFHDHILRSDESYAQKWEYVRENPVRVGLVNAAADWPYAGEIVSIDRV
ncbi:MAG: histidinol-phosphate transaminase [Chthoniobacterales bacterium]|nr:histidinol-phosphate transaminase [Chthoniobacterales bacterium]